MELNISDDDLDRIFAALSHPDRRALLERLAVEGEARVTDLAEGFDVSLNQVSKHLKTLERAGLVRRRKEGREHRLSADLRSLMGARSWIDAYRRFWQESLEGLDAYLDATTPRREERQSDGHGS